MGKHRNITRFECYSVSNTHDDGSHTAIVALAGDDGTLWEFDLGRWHPLPPLPARLGWLARWWRDLIRRN
jgi:hypothetical protein